MSFRSDRTSILIILSSGVKSSLFTLDNQECTAVKVDENLTAIPAWTFM
jgi:hypothetical protein